jgi:hypothetical protein
MAGTVTVEPAIAALGFSSSSQALKPITKKNSMSEIVAMANLWSARRHRFDIRVLRRVFIEYPPRDSPNLNAHAPPKFLDAHLPDRARLPRPRVQCPLASDSPDPNPNAAKRRPDVDKVDAIADVPTSSVALAVNEIIRDKDEVFLAVGPATPILPARPVRPTPYTGSTTLGRCGARSHQPQVP